MYTITSAKGSYTDDNLLSVCAWQAEMQAAFAEVNGVSVDDIDFDPDHIGPAVRAVAGRLADPDNRFPAWPNRFSREEAKRFGEAANRVENAIYAASSERRAALQSKQAKFIAESVAALPTSANFARVVAKCNRESCASERLTGVHIAAVKRVRDWYNAAILKF